MDTNGAVFPLTVDPLTSSANWTALSDRIDVQFGWSVSTAGDVNGDGYADVIVGAPWYNNGENDEGRTYVYHGSPTGLSFNAAWTAESNESSVNFGFSVSTAGDVNGDGFDDVIVGAHLSDRKYNDEYTFVDAGRAYVYHGSSTGLSPSPAWIAEPGSPQAFFGYSVSAAGDVNGDGFDDVVVGAPEDAINLYKLGRVYVYHGSSTGLNLNADWTASSNNQYSFFGNSVSSAGDVNGDGFDDIVVGAYKHDNTIGAPGKAFVYHGSSTGLSLTPSWTPEQNPGDVDFGYSVSTAGDVNGDGFDDIVVGASAINLNGYGRAYVYHGSSTGLNLSADWAAMSENEHLDTHSYFGYSVSTAGDFNGDGFDDVVVGAPEDEVYIETADQTLRAGRAYIYYGSPMGLSLSADWEAESDQILSFLGCSVSTAGDVNGDGFDDIILGASKYDYLKDTLYRDEGRVFAFYGGSDKLPKTAAMPWIPLLLLDE